MRKALQLISLLLIGYIFVGCSENVPTINSDKADQTRIFQAYKVSYRAYSKELTATAAFHLNNTSGEIVKLTGKSEVLFEKMDMEWQEQGYYQKTGNKFIEKPAFKYINNDGQIFQNKFTVKKIEFKQDNISLQKGAENVFKCKGPDMDFNESIYLSLHINNDEVEIQADMSQNNIVLAEHALDEIPTGTYTGCLVRRNFDTNVHSLDRGGVWESEYYSNQKQITIK